MMFLPCLSCICVVLLINPSFFKCADCVLLIQPRNVAAVSGEVVTLHCASNISKDNIAWSVTNKENYIYFNKNLAQSVSSYISVSDRDDGNCSLNINASLTAAKRYVCVERDSGQDASAELVVVENNIKCNSTVTEYNNGSFHLTIYNVFAGNWLPAVECVQRNGNIKLTGFEKNVVTITGNDIKGLDFSYCAKLFGPTKGLMKMLEPCFSLQSNCPKHEGGCFWLVVIAILSIGFTSGRDRFDSAI